MTIRWRFRWISLIAVFAFTITVRGQILELPENIHPPRLGESTAVKSMIAGLENEITTLLIDPPPDHSPEFERNRASRNIRIIAADLLTAGDEAGEKGNIAILSGSRLYDARESLDGLFVAMSAPPSEDLNPDIAESDPPSKLQNALLQFNDRATAMMGQFQTADPEEIDRLLPELFALLIEPAHLVTGEAVQNQWPDIFAVRVQPLFALPPHADLTARLVALHTQSDTREALLHLATLIQRGQSFSDLASSAEKMAVRVAEVMDFLESLNAAEWLDDPQKQTYANRLHQAIILFTNPETRVRGATRLRGLNSSGRLIRHITALRNGNELDASALMVALPIADDLNAKNDRPEPSLERIELLLRIADLMIEFRELPEAAIAKRDIEKSHDKLLKKYRETEATLLDRLDEVAANPEALADPDLGSLLVDPRQYLEDIKRIRRVPDWIDAVALLNPELRATFSKRVFLWGRWLLQLNRRPDTIDLMRQFEDELNRFVPLPYETQLIGESPSALLATGGKQRELLHRVQAERRKWVAFWSEGRSDSAAGKRLRSIYELTQIMEEFAGLSSAESDAALLNHWAGWELPPAIILRPTRDLTARLKLATNAAVDEEFDTLARHLETIARTLPLLKLQSQLYQRLIGALNNSPSGVSAVLGQLIHPPTRSAWWFTFRTRLAELCRYAREAEYARSQSNLEQAASILEYVNVLAEELLAILDQNPSSLTP